MSELSEKEQLLLQEYARLNQNLKMLNTQVEKLNLVPTPKIMDVLRVLESKSALVYTLLQSSVYSIFVQQGESEHLNNSGNQQKDEESDVQAEQLVHGQQPPDIEGDDYY